MDEGRKYGEDLRPIWHFDGADLDSNRADLLSPNQRRRLWRREWLKVAGATACLVPGGLLNVALLARWITVHGRGAGLGLGLMIVGVVIAWSSAQLWLDLSSGRVSTAEGDLKLTNRRTRSGIQWSIAIDGKSFDVSEECKAQIIQGPRKLYYLPRSKAVLSIEPARFEAAGGSAGG